MHCKEFDTIILCSKTVGRGDKTTWRVQAQLLALLENPRLDRVRVLTIQENPCRERVCYPALRENPRRERVLDRWFEARDSSVDILILCHAQNTSSVKEMTSSFRSIYKKNMPNNITAYPICKINLSFISFLWVEQWSGGADGEQKYTRFQHNWFTEVNCCTVQCCWVLTALTGVVRILWILILKGIDSDERITL